VLAKHLLRAERCITLLDHALMLGSVADGVMKKIAGNGFDERVAVEFE